MERSWYSKYSGGKKLPIGLQFLKTIRFHSIVKFKKAGKTRYRIEISSIQLKRLLEKAKTKGKIATELVADKLILENDIKGLLGENEKLKKRCENLQYELSDRCKKNQERFDKLSRGIKSPKSPLQKIQENHEPIEERKVFQGGTVGL